MRVQCGPVGDEEQQGPDRRGAGLPTAWARDMSGAPRPAYRDGRSLVSFCFLNATLQDRVGSLSLESNQDKMCALFEACVAVGGGWVGTFLRV